MRCLLSASTITRALLATGLLTSFSNSAAVATPTSTAVRLSSEIAARTSLTGFCAECEETGDGEGEWGDSCDEWVEDVEFAPPGCRQCPMVGDVAFRCDGGSWTVVGGGTVCDEACDDPTLVEQLDAAVMRDDPVAVRALLSEHNGTVSFHTERKSIQVEGCGGKIVANLPVGDRTLATLK